MKRLCLTLGFLSLLASMSQAQNFFAAPQEMDGNILFVADFDGDGDQDLLRANTALILQGTVTVLLNDGQGAFVDGPQTPLFSNAARPSVVADINGDGVADLVVPVPSGTVPTGPGFYLHPGLSGGNFGVPIFVGLEGGVFSMKAADVNGDGRQDLAILNYDETLGVKRLRWFTSMVGNSFSPSTGLVFPLLSNGPFALEVLDVDGDGTIDIAGSGVAPSALMLFPTVAGDVTDGVDLILPLSNDPRLSLGDFNGDGLVDVFCHESAVGGIRTNVALNGGAQPWSVGSATLRPGVALGPIFHADWDSDGDVDAFVRGSPDFGGDYSLLTNDGMATFSLAFSRPISGLANGGAGFADLNSDGFIDFVGANDIWFGEGSAVDHHVPVLSFANELIDFDLDGDLDLIGSGGNVQINNGRGEFVLENKGFPQPPGMFFYDGDVMVRDFNEDGISDYLVAYLESPGPFMIPIFHEMRLLQGTIENGFLDVGAAAPPGERMNIQDGSRTPLVDINGDGVKDVLTVGGPWLGTVPGQYSSPLDLYPGWRPVDAGDVDGDGIVDLLAYSSSTPFMVAILHNDGNLGFTAEILATSGFSSEPQNNISRLRDLDDDGDLDVAFDSGTSGTTVIEIVENLGTSFAAPISFPTPTLGNTVMDGADMDGDGLTDLVVGDGPSFRFYRRTGPGFSYEPARVYLGGGMTHLRDIDNDGDVDILGGAVTFNRRHFGLAGGHVRQFGFGSPGHGGFVPKLSLIGPVRPNEFTTISLRHAATASTAILLAGYSSSVQVDVPFPGNTLYVSPIAGFFYFQTLGPFGVPGFGGLDLNYQIPPFLAGNTVYLQYVIVDAFGAAPLTTSNAIEINYGL